MNGVCVGLWLDHKKAIFAKNSDDHNEVFAINSNLDRRSKSTGGSRGALPYSFNGGGAPEKKDRRRDHTLDEYYQEILAQLKKVDKVFLMGPGLAKLELKKVLDKKRVGKKVVAVETCGPMTNRQLAALTKRFFERGA